MTDIPQAARDFANDLLDDPQALVRLLADNPQLLPKPEPDRLTVAARECMAVDCTGASAKLIMDGKFDESDEFRDTRDIIAREVAAVEPNDEAIGRAADYFRPLMLSGGVWACDEIRAALKGEGA